MELNSAVRLGRRAHPPPACYRPSTNLARVRAVEPESTHSQYSPGGRCWPRDCTAWQPKVPLACTGAERATTEALSGPLGGRSPDVTASMTWEPSPPLVTRRHACTLAHSVRPGSSPQSTVASHTTSSDTTGTGLTDGVAAAEGSSLRTGGGSVGGAPRGPELVHPREPTSASARRKPHTPDGGTVSRLFTSAVLGRPPATVPLRGGVRPSHPAPAPGRTTGGRLTRSSSVRVRSIQFRFPPCGSGRAPVRCRLTGHCRRLMATTPALPSNTNRLARPAAIQPDGVSPCGPPLPVRGILCGAAACPAA